MSTGSIFLLPNGTWFVELAVVVIILWVVTKYALPMLNAAIARQPEIENKARQYFFLTVGLVEAMYFINLLFMVVFVYVFKAQ